MPLRHRAAIVGDGHQHGLAVQIVEYSIVASVVVLPFSYLPLLMVARDADIMGPHANGMIANSLGWFYLLLITLAAILALPLFFLTHEGQG